jgi:hypothetical protein
LSNRNIHLCLFKLGYDVHALLCTVMYILSGENITAVYTMSRLLRHENSWHVANRLDRAGATYVRLLHGGGGDKRPRRKLSVGKVLRKTFGGDKGKQNISSVRQCEECHTP